MPPIFKALATIAAWVLFVVGCLTVGSNLAMGIVMGEYFNPDKLPSAVMFLAAAVGLASLILSVVAMKLRKMLE